MPSNHFLRDINVMKIRVASGIKAATYDLVYQRFLFTMRGCVLVES